MLSFKSSLPVFLVLSSLLSPLALRADQVPLQADIMQQATDVSYSDLQADPVFVTTDDTAILVSSEPTEVDPIEADPIIADPIEVPIKGFPVDGGPTLEPIDPIGSPITAVTPEPSGLVLLATGVLCGAFFWMRRGSFAMTAC